METWFGGTHKRLTMEREALRVFLLKLDQFLAGIKFWNTWLKKKRQSKFWLGKHNTKMFENNQKQEKCGTLFEVFFL